MKDQIQPGIQCFFNQDKMMETTGFYYFEGETARTLSISKLGGR